jgi:rRNA maturation endonuclease Nob1
LKAKHLKKEDSILVLDTCAILSGFSSHLAGVSQLTTPDVIGELPEAFVDSTTRLPLMDETSIDVVSPSEEYLRKADETVKTAGDVKVSMADKSLLALSLQLRDANRRPILVSDDYGLQNLAKMSAIRYLPYVEKGIRRQYSWKLICPACFKQYPSSYQSTVCSICGTKLRRRARGSGKAKRSQPRS